MAKYDYKKIFSVMGISVMLMIFPGCDKSNDIEERFDIAENLMEDQPDSSLSILESLDESMLKGGRVKARYALLKSMALDKNYIDTTTFDVLQPAIDYYLKHGNADEKLRTYYYQGRIYRNAGKYDSAMQSYLKGLDLKKTIVDSLTMARLYVAQSTLFYRQYRISEFVDNNVKAGIIFGRKGQIRNQLNSYLKALNGAIILEERSKSDSIVKICKAIIKDSPMMKKESSDIFLRYETVFGNTSDIQQAIADMQEMDRLDGMSMTLALAYSKIGEASTGLRYLNEANIAPDNILDSLTYWSIKTEVLENMGEYKESLDAFRSYNSLLEKYHTQLFSNELLFSEQKHAMEIDNMVQIQKRESVMKWILTGVALLMVLTLFIYYRYRMNRAGRLIAEGNAERLRLNNEKLHLEGEKQRLLAEKLESERAQLKLEAENLHHKIEEMEGEQTQLKDLLDSQETLSEEARQLIRERIGLLNGLIAQALTEQESYGKEFKSYIAKIKKDKKGFQQSLVKVLETTHPEFMAYLKEHGLTERELNYCCLYAIGMRGKEIGTYLDLARHYNISTEVRRKLGLATNSENLGPFLRQLMDNGE